MFFIDYSRKDGRLKGIRDARALKVLSTNQVHLCKKRYLKTILYKQYEKEKDRKEKYYILKL